MTSPRSMPNENFRQETIATFRAVTAVKTDDEAIRHLEESAWDLERAANRYFGSATETENQSQPSTTSTDAPTLPSTQPQPRASPQQPQRSEITTLTAPNQRHNQVTEPNRPFPGWLVAMTSPFRFVWSVISSITNTIMQILGGPARAIEAAPGDTPTRRFINFFESRYGTNHPTFFDGSYLSALSSAHSEIRFLLVYLHSESHRLTQSFCTEVLGNPTFITTANESCIMWAGSVSQRDGAAAYHNLRAPAFPFLAVVAAPTRPSNDIRRSDFGTVLAVRAGPTAVSGGGEATTAWLERVIRRHDPMLESIRQQRIERESARLLREQQDEEFAASLAADRKREQEAVEQKAREDEERQRLQDLEIRRQRKKEALGDEPEKGPGIASISLRLPDGSRVGRRFNKNDALELVFDWAEVNRVDIESACLVVSFPRNKFRYPEDAGTTIEQAGLFPSCMFLLEEREDEE